MKYVNKYYPVLIILFLFLLAASCGKEAPSVNPGDYTQGSGGTPPGYYYPFVTAVYPTGTGVPVNTNYVIVFNMPVDADDFASQITVTGAGVPSYSFSPATGASTTATITFASQLPAGTDFTVTVGSGIHELVSGTSVPIVLTAGIGYTWTFQTGAAPDVTVPAIAAGTNSPTGAGVALNTTIELSFTEAGEIDISSVNSNTFYVRDSSLNLIACSVSYAAATNTVTLTPVSNLQTSETYTVTVTTGIKDLSGNSLSAGTSWSFDTVLVLDPLLGDPVITAALAVPYVSSTTADLTWTTNEPTNYTIHYGQGDDTGTSIPFLSDYSSTHSYNLNPPLSAGSRYYTNVTFRDYAGNPIASPELSNTVEFNTETNETPLTIDTSDENQRGLNWITYHPSAGNTGAFMFWSDYITGSYYLYGQLYDSDDLYTTYTGQWNGGARKALFTGASTTYLSSVEDGVSGVIVLTTRTGTDIYAKRINSAGTIVNWGAGADNAANAGLSIGTGTSASAVPVYGGVFTSITDGTTEMSSMSLLNPFADFGVNLSGLTDGYVIMDPNNHDGTIIDNNTVTQDYRYILGQNANIIAPTETYNIGDNVTNTITFTAQDHAMNVFGNRTNGLNRVYSEHGITLADLTALNIGVGDIIRNGANYGYITAAADIAVSAIDSGTESANRTNHLIDGSKTWTATIAIGDLAERTVGAAYAVITNVTNTDLTLSADIYPNGNENYAIHDTTDSGTATSYTLNCLNDSTATWNTVGPTQVFVGDIVIRTNATYSTIQAIDTVTSVSNTQLQFSSELFPIGNENYIIYKQGNLDTGTANPTLSFHLIDGGATWNTPGPTQVVVNDLVRNTTDNTYTTVTAVTDTDLTLLADIFPDAGNDNYEIYHEYCTTHTTTPIDTFVRLTVNWNIGVANGGSVTLYNTLVTGTADTPRTNPLYDDGVDLSAVAANDIVLNFNAGGSWTYANNTTYNGSGALGLAANIMSDNNYYRIVSSDDGAFTAANITDIGAAVGGAGTTLVTDGGATVYQGDIAYNLTDNDFAIVTSAAGANLTLSTNAQFNAGDYYVIVSGSVLYVWQNGANIDASICSISNGTLLRSIPSLIAAATNPYTFSDGNGNAYVVYTDAAGEIMVRLINTAGQNVWTGPANPEIDTQTAVNETILKVISDNAGGIVVLYQYGATPVIHAQRITNGGATGNRAWGVNGYNFGNPAAIDSTTAFDMAYNGANDVIVTAQIGNKIWAARRGALFNWGGAWVSNPATGFQRYPKIFVRNWTAGNYATIVWEDDRFYSATAYGLSAGYGIFGMQVEATTGAKNVPAWRANASGTNDDNGVSVVLNSGNKYWPLGIKIVTYNNGADGALIWEDWRNVNATLPYNGSDLLYIDIEAFVPY